MTTQKMTTEQAADLLGRQLNAFRSGPHGLILTDLPPHISRELITQAYEALGEDAKNQPWYWVPTPEQAIRLDKAEWPYKDAVVEKVLAWTSDNRKVQINDEEFFKLVEAEKTAYKAEEEAKEAFLDLAIGRHPQADPSGEVGLLIRLAEARWAHTGPNQVEKVKAAIRLRPEFTEQFTAAFLNAFVDLAPQFRDGMRVVGVGAEMERTVNLDTLRLKLAGEDLFKELEAALRGDHTHSGRPRRGGLTAFLADKFVFGGSGNPCDGCQDPCDEESGRTPDRERF